MNGAFWCWGACSGHSFACYDHLQSVLFCTVFISIGPQSSLGPLRLCSLTLHKLWFRIFPICNAKSLDQNVSGPPAHVSMTWSCDLIVLKRCVCDLQPSSLFSTLDTLMDMLMFYCSWIALCFISYPPSSIFIRTITPPTVNKIIFPHHFCLSKYIFIIIQYSFHKLYVCYRNKPNCHIC